MRSVVKAVGLTAALSSASFTAAEDVGAELDLHELMKEATCGNFDLRAPDDPYDIPGYETPVRVSAPES